MISSRLRVMLILALPEAAFAFIVGQADVLFAILLFGAPLVCIFFQRVITLFGAVWRARVGVLPLIP